MRAPIRPCLADAALAVARRLPPETANHLAFWALRAGLVGEDRSANDPILRTSAFGLDFANPIGLAAGLDKEAQALPELAGLGFGFVEAGSVTLRPQPGNPRPRLFRLVKDRAVINRMGFNSDGIEGFTARLRAHRPPVPVGANLGLNKEGADPERDYAALAAAIGDAADYLVVNVSSPNTPGLRDLQAEARLAAIISSIRGAVPAGKPVLVKLAPDLSPEALPGIVETCVAHGIQGLIVSNTTVTRPPGLRSAQARETGGLSGAPLFARSTALLARVRLLAGDRLTLIGAGGVFTAEDALAKIMAGARLVQLYTALIYEGPSLVGRIKHGLAARLRAHGFSRLDEAVGVAAARFASLV